jgi:hypothetical protein
VNECGKTGFDRYLAAHVTQESTTFGNDASVKEVPSLHRCLADLML